MPGKLLVMENGAAKYYGEWSDEALARVEEPEVYRRRTGSGVAVEVENLWFKYPGEKPLFKGVSFTIEKSSLAGLTGRNGAGKTTLLKLMAGVLKPLKGSVRRFGRATYIPENPLLYFTKPTPREELLYAAGGGVDAVEEAVELFNLAGVLDRPLAKLSSGERRRLALASAYLGGFDIYLVDEPTGGLDQANAVRVLDALTRLVENGGTVVVATHDKRVVSLLDDDIRVGD
ncbi:energy-coupling factor ABC transporter ATP-binding protein [Desulfurococcus mucosus]